MAAAASFGPAGTGPGAGATILRVELSRAGIASAIADDGVVRPREATAGDADRFEPFPPDGGG